MRDREIQEMEIREALAVGDAFVTTLEDVRMVRDRAVAAERERCARIAEGCEIDNYGEVSRWIADKIRSGE